VISSGESIRWWRWALAAVAAGALVRYGARFPWLATWQTLRAADWRLLAAAAVANLLSLACKAGGWQLLLAPLAPARARSTQAATFAGAAVGSVGVALSGEATRLGVVTQRDGIGTTPAARALAGSRVVEAAALFAVLAGCAGVSAGGATGWRLPFGATALALAALSLARWLPWLRPRGADGRRVSAWGVGRLLGAMSWAIAAWLLQWATYHWAIAATRAPVTPAQSLLALLLANLGGIFRLTPGNVGVVQAAVVAGLAPAGVSAAHAIAAGLALQAVEVLPVVGIGLAMLGRHGLARAGAGAAAPTQAAPRRRPLPAA
jgi:uncharacterized membrane protein YbhN (UPF0104 family)